MVSLPPAPRSPRCGEGRTTRTAERLEFMVQYRSQAQTETSRRDPAGPASAQVVRGAPGPPPKIPPEPTNERVLRCEFEVEAVLGAFHPFNSHLKTRVVRSGLAHR